MMRLIFCLGSAVNDQLHCTRKSFLRLDRCAFKQAAETPADFLTSRSHN
jgi:hypothetical protein